MAHQSMDQEGGGYRWRIAFPALIRQWKKNPSLVIIYRIRPMEKVDENVSISQMVHHTPSLLSHHVLVVIK